ncbi:MAG TPA: hypothetical protein VF532_22015 [Candidatus Angelobacter sp.]
MGAYTHLLQCDSGALNTFAHSRWRDVQVRRDFLIGLAADKAEDYHFLLIGRQVLDGGIKADALFLVIVAQRGLSRPGVAITDCIHADHLALAPAVNVDAVIPGQLRQPGARILDLAGMGRHLGERLEHGSTQNIFRIFRRPPHQLQTDAVKVVFVLQPKAPECGTITL